MLAELDCKKQLPASIAARGGPYKVPFPIGARPISANVVSIMDGAKSIPLGGWLAGRETLPIHT